MKRKISLIKTACRQGIKKTWDSSMKKPGGWPGLEIFCVLVESKITVKVKNTIAETRIASTIKIMYRLMGISALAS
ncbi:MAG: hypothetical protein IPQ03_08700 [Bacteroidetes bacterium]|nr:hypothetical protein [Bacteroidota bacterium]